MTEHLAARSRVGCGLNLVAGGEFPDPSTKTIVFSPTLLPLASNTILLQDIVLPVVFINPNDSSSDAWRSVRL